MRATILLLILLPAAAAGPVGVNPTGDAEGDIVAVSGTGHAHARCTAGTLPCATVSVLGTTSGARTTVEVAGMRACVFDGLSPPHCVANGDGDSHGPVALTRGGTANGWILAASANGTAEGGYVAITTEGEARSTWVALAANGRAAGLVALSVWGEADGSLVGVRVADHLP